MTIRLNLPPKGRRLIYDLTAGGLPEIPYLAAQNLPFSAAGLPWHTHKERMEINHILKGERVYCVGGKEYHLRGNDIFIVWPHERHGSGAHLHGRGAHFWMQTVIPKPGSPFLGFDADRVRPLLAALWAMPRRHFRAAPGMRALNSRILSLCRDGQPGLARVELSALLIEWFLLLASAATRESEERTTPDIARALEMIARNGNTHLDIGALAAAACLSESRFKGKFREQLGVPPGEYLLRRRTEMAADLLMRGKLSLTGIALELGFSSAQHFSGTFKKFFGQSPYAWVKRQQEENMAWSADPGIDDGEDVFPWVDAHGQLHGYVDKSHRGGRHPDN